MEEKTPNIETEVNSIEIKNSEEFTDFTDFTESIEPNELNNITDSNEFSTTMNSKETEVGAESEPHLTSIEKMAVIKQYQKALIVAINNLKSDVSAASELKKEDEVFSSYYSTKKILNELQRKINKNEVFTEKEFSLLSTVCYLNAERMTSYANAILEQTETVTHLAKIFMG